MRSYYILDGNKELGPFTLLKIKEQKLTKNTPVRFEGVKDWTTAEQIEELNAVVAAQEMMPEKKVSAPEQLSLKPVLQKKKKLQKNKVMAASGGLVLVLAGLLIHFNNSKTDSPILTPEQTIAAIEKPLAEAPATTVTEVAKPKTIVNNEVNAKEKSFRKNWSKYIHVDNSSYAYGILGGINDLSVIIKNKTDYPLDEVTAKVTYIKSNGKVWKSKMVTTYGVPAHSQKQEPLPKVNRGKTVQISICKVVSKKMHFSYTEGKRGAIADDPYFSK